MNKDGINLTLVPYGLNRWNVILIHDNRNRTNAGHIERHKSLGVTLFHAFNENGSLIKKDFTLQSAEETIRKRQKRNQRRQQR